MRAIKTSVYKISSTPVEISKIKVQAECNQSVLSGLWKYHVVSLAIRGADWMIVFIKDLTIVRIFDDSGTWRSLVARLTGGQEVASSNLVVPILS